MKIFFSDNERYLALLNSALNENFIDVIGNKSDAAATGDTTSIIAKLKYIIANLTSDADVAALIGALNTVAHAGATDDVTTVMGYIKQLVTALIAVKADLDNGGRLDLLIDDILADTNELQADWANGGRLDVMLDDITAFVDSTDTAVSKIENISNGTTAPTDATLRQIGKTQFKSIAVTSAANAGIVNLGTATGGDVRIKSVTVYSRGATSADLTSAGVFANAAQATTLISAATATQAALNAEGKQVSFSGAAHVPTTKTVDIDLQGTGATAISFTVVVEYMAVSNGAYLA